MRRRSARRSSNLLVATRGSLACSEEVVTGRLVEHFAGSPVELSLTRARSWWLNSSAALLGRHVEAVCGEAHEQVIDGGDADEPADRADTDRSISTAACAMVPSGTMNRDGPY